MRLADLFLSDLELSGCVSSVFYENVLRDKCKRTLHFLSLYLSCKGEGVLALPANKASILSFSTSELFPLRSRKRLLILLGECLPKLEDGFLCSLTRVGARPH